MHPQWAPSWPRFVANCFCRLLTLSGSFVSLFSPGRLVYSVWAENDWPTGAQLLRGEDYVLIRFLRATGFVAPYAHRVLQKCLEWRAAQGLFFEDPARAAVSARAAPMFVRTPRNPIATCFPWFQGFSGMLFVLSLGRRRGITGSQRAVSQSRCGASVRYGRTKSSSGSTRMRSTGSGSTTWRSRSTPRET